VPVADSRVPTGARGTLYVDRRGVEAINLRTYGWADRYIFGRSQEVVADVRRLAKARPKAVPVPRPPRQVLVFEAEPGDDRLAREHVRRGWPPRLPVRGVPHDYVVFGPGENPVERCIKTSDVMRRRAVRRLGTEDVQRTIVSPTVGDVLT
jgi:hypothetical protein